MSEQPWETHDPLCPNRRPTVAFPNSACSGCRAVVAARAEGYARGLIEGDHGGRREGYRSGYAAGKDAVMTASYAQAVAEGQRDERERIASAVMPILATLARHACTAENWEQTDALTRRSVTDVKAAIRARSNDDN